MHNEEDINRIVDKYMDMIKRICFLYLKSNSDIEDITQNIFIKYMLSNKIFENEEHEKSWFIKVTINACKDNLKSFFRKNTVPLDSYMEHQEVTQENKDVLEAVLSLPKKYKDVIYLYYYEEYKAVEIAKILGKNVNTVYTLLDRAKKQLKEKMEVDDG